MPNELYEALIILAYLVIFVMALGLAEIAVTMIANIVTGIKKIIL